MQLSKIWSNLCIFYLHDNNYAMNREYIFSKNARAYNQAYNT